jgi:hypothetical protein
MQNMQRRAARFGRRLQAQLKGSKAYLRSQGNPLANHKPQPVWRRVRALRTFVRIKPVAALNVVFVLMQRSISGGFCKVSAACGGVPGCHARNRIEDSASQHWARPTATIDERSVVSCARLQHTVAPRNTLPAAHHAAHHSGRASVGTPRTSLRIVLHERSWHAVRGCRDGGLPGRR